MQVRIWARGVVVSSLMRVGVVLAAGGSRRWGQGNKLLARTMAGEALVLAAVRAARAAPVARVIVVVGWQGERVARAVRALGLRVRIVRARDHATGQAASVRAGLAALWPGERALFVYLGDMPAVPPHLPARLARALRCGDEGVRPDYRGVPGHPLLLRRPTRDVRARLVGDRGLGSLLTGVRRIAGPRGAVIDIDRRTDRARLR